MKNRLQFMVFGKVAIAFSFFILYFSFAQGQLSGVYTIDPSGSGAKNYTTFANAVNTLAKKGVKGPVVFNIANGVYSEHVTIPFISGSSDTNTIIFQSASGDSSKVTLTNSSSSGSGNNFTLRMNGTNYITLQKITVSRTDPDSNDYATVVEIDSPSNYNNILNCQVLGSRKFNYNNISNIRPETKSLIYSATNNNNSNTFKNNLLRYGTYAVFFNYLGTYSPFSLNNKIVGNILDSNTYSGIGISYQDGLQITGNVITNSVLYADCIDIWNCSGSLTFTKNKILPFSANSILALSLQGCEGTSSQRVIVANNVFTGGGVEIGDNSNQDFFYNTVYCAGESFLYNQGPVQGYKTDSIENNIFENMGTGGRVVDISDGGSICVCDYNDIYTSNVTSYSVLGLYNQTYCSNLSQWQAASGFDAHSVSTNAFFKSGSYLYPTSPKVYRTGASIASLNDDIDGTLRNATPCMGAYEVLSVLQNDAGIPSINNPYQNYCAGTYNVKATIANFGAGRLTSAVVHWMVNGVLQNPYNWTGSLQTTDSANFFIGAYTFNSNSAYTLKAWTTSPNGGVDSIHTNDTATNFGLLNGLSGIFTIGHSGADYSSFTAAISALREYGVCGPVVFNVANGTYYECLTIDTIFGSNRTNTVTFQSASGDSTMVVLYDTFATTQSYTATVGAPALTIGGQGFVIFQKMTIESSLGGYKFNPGVVSLYGPGNVVLNNNVILFNAFIEKLNESSPVISIFSDSALINNNIIRNSYYGIGIEQSGNSILNSNTIIENNSIDSFGQGGIVLSFPDNSIHIRHNLIHNPYTNPDPNYFNYAVGIEDDANGATLIIIDNYIDGIQAGIFISGAKDTIANNIINVELLGISITDSPSSYSNILNNTLVAGLGGSIEGSNWQNNAKILNNTIVNPGGGPIFMFDNALDSGTIIDYNDYQLDIAPNFNQYNPSYKSTFYDADTDLVEWQKATGYDTHSLGLNPLFANPTNLRATNDSIEGKGIYVSGITTDIDGNIRPNPPTIGANEIPDREGVKPIQRIAPPISLYPNPATSTLNIESTSSIIQSIVIFDATGREVYQSENLKTQNQSVFVNSFPSGIYIIKIASDNGSYTAKFMKE